MLDFPLHFHHLSYKDRISSSCPLEAVTRSFLKPWSLTALSKQDEVGKCPLELLFIQDSNFNSRGLRHHWRQYSIGLLLIILSRKEHRRMQNLRPALGLLHQNVLCSKIPRRLLCTLKLEKYCFNFSIWILNHCLAKCTKIIDFGRKRRRYSPLISVQNFPKYNNSMPRWADSRRSINTI